MSAGLLAEPSIPCLKNVFAMVFHLKTNSNKNPDRKNLVRLDEAAETAIPNYIFRLKHTSPYFKFYEEHKLMQEQEKKKEYISI